MHQNLSQLMCRWTWLQGKDPNIYVWGMKFNFDQNEDTKTQLEVRQAGVKTRKDIEYRQTNPKTQNKVQNQRMIGSTWPP